MGNYYSGMSFPFRFGANGGVRGNTLTPEEHDRIKESIRQILFTRKGERIFQPDFGSRLPDYVFESIEDLDTRALLKFEVENAIREQEPRVEVLEVRVYTSPDEEGKLIIDVDVLIIQFATEATLNYQMSTYGNVT